MDTVSRSEFTFTALRTDAYSGLEREVEIKAEIRLGHGNEPWLFLINGPTGYESMPVDHIPQVIEHGGGWAACFGTPYIPGGKAWDRLIVPSSELRKVVEALS